MIGYCGLTEFPGTDGRPEIVIGFRFALGSWRRGYATESAVAVRDYAFRTLRIPRLIAIIDPGNTASIRVVEKLGVTYEKDVMLPGYDYPDRMYAMRRPDKLSEE